MTMFFLDEITFYCSYHTEEMYKCPWTVRIQALKKKNSIDALIIGSG